jgi:hypothetical protein
MDLLTHLMQNILKEPENRGAGPSAPAPLFSGNPHGKIETIKVMNPWWSRLLKMRAGIRTLIQR